MNFSLSNTIVPRDLRTAFRDLIRKEIDSRDPAEGAKLALRDEPEQMRFNFTYTKKFSP